MRSLWLADDDDGDDNDDDDDDDDDDRGIMLLSSLCLDTCVDTGFCHFLTLEVQNNNKLEFEFRREHRQSSNRRFGSSKILPKEIV